MKSCLICATALILVLLALRPLLRHTSARLRYALWALVLLRLALPFDLVSSGLSVMNFVPRETEQSRPTAAEPAGFPMAEGDAFAPETGGSLPEENGFGQGENSEPTDAVPVPEAPEAGRTLALEDGWKLVWLSGSLIVGACFVLSNAVFALRLRRKRRFWMRYGSLPVYCAEGLATPCLFGLLPPAIYIPPEMAEREELREYVLLHESVHYRHLDWLWSVARGLCLTVYWFHPLVWLAAWLSRRDGELACDETALRDMDWSRRIAYGRTLLALADTRKGSPLRLATSMTAGRRELSARIRAIAERRKTVLGALVLALLVAAVAVGCTFTGAKGEGRETPPVVTVTDDSTTVTLLEGPYPNLTLDYGGESYAPDRRVCSWQTGDTATEAALTHPTIWAAESLVLLPWQGTERITLCFDQTPESVVMQVWDMSAIGSGETASMQMEPTVLAEEIPETLLETDSFYLVRAKFAQGWVEYLFGLSGGDRDLPLEGELPQTPPGTDAAGVPLLQLCYGGSWITPASRPEIWDGIAWDSLAPMEWAAAEPVPTLWWQGTTTVEYQFAELPEQMTLCLWRPESLGSGAAAWETRELEPAQQGSLELRSDGSGYYLLTVQFARGTAQYLFCLSQTDPNGARRVYGSDSVGVGMVLDYVDESRLVFHGYYGLCVYDLEQERLLCRVDFLQALGCNRIQGGSYVAVEVAADGSEALCHVEGDAERPTALRVNLQTGTATVEPEYVPLRDRWQPGETGALTQSGSTLSGLQYSDGSRSWKLLPEGLIPAAALE